jgi:hypothetical protein
MRFFVAGLCNLETTVKIPDFPLEYHPVRYPFFGIATAPSGVGLNLLCGANGIGRERTALYLYRYRCTRARGTEPTRGTQG